MAKKATAVVAKPIAPNLDEVVILAKRQVQLEEQVADAENALKDLKEMLRRVCQEDLPEAMFEAGLKEFVLDSGEKVSVKPDFEIQTLAENREPVYDWLESHGYGGLIKTEVIVSFGKGELTKAQALLNALAKKDLNCNLTRGVHYQTFKAFVGEQTREHKRLPLDLFGVNPINKAKITAPKRKE